MEGRLDVAEHLRPGFPVEVRQIRERFKGGVEQPVVLGEGYGLHPTGCMRKDKIAIVRGLYVRDREKGSGRAECVGWILRRLCAALYGQPDRGYRPVALHGSDQRLPDGRLDLELRPGLRVDHGLEERYDDGFAGV